MGIYMRAMMLAYTACFRIASRLLWLFCQLWRASRTATNTAALLPVIVLVFLLCPHPRACAGGVIPTAEGKWPGTAKVPRHATAVPPAARSRRIPSCSWLLLLPQRAVSGKMPHRLAPSASHSGLQLSASGFQLPALVSRSGLPIVSSDRTRSGEKG